MLTIGQTLQNRYRIEAILGQGGMGAVYRAIDHRLERAFVVKEMLITSDAANNPAEAERQFQKEARTLAGLRHPNLPVVHDYFAEGGSYYLVMDLIAGRSLEELIPPDGLPEAVVLSYADQLLAILDYIHANGVLHRDIKPANIIIQPDGRPALVDFGLVKVIQPGAGKTTTGFVRGMGTPEYAPPEQAIGRTDQRSDIYALGATLYHALTGQAPATATERVAEEALIDPRHLQPGVSAQTEQVILKAMALKKTERYADASAMRAALTGRAYTAPPPPAEAERPPTPALRVTRVIEKPQPMPIPAQRRVSPVTLGGGLALVAAAIVAVALLSSAGRLAVSPSATVIATMAATNVTPITLVVPTYAPDSSATPRPKPTSTHSPPSPTPVLPTNTPTANSLLLKLAPGVTLELVRVPAGEFLMGSADSDKDANSDEKPQSKLNLNEYLIGIYDVTNAQFRAFVQATGYKSTAEAQGSAYAFDGTNWQDTNGADWQHPRGPNSNIDGRDNYPVVQVSWDDAVAFCKWVSQTSGRQILLPSEAQWEKAARGTDGRVFPWGNSEPDTSRLNYNMNVKDVTETGKYSPAGDSPYGAADMAGNVWQWTSSLYKPYPYNATDGREDQSSRDARVLRGGGFGDGRRFVRSADRDRYVPDGRSDYYGFRVVASPI